MVGTWLAFGGVDLHLLQTVVVVFLGRNVPLDLRVWSAVEETTFLFHLSFVDTFVDLHREIVHILRRSGSISTSNLVLDLILQSSIELCRDGFVVPAGLNYQSLELGLVFRYRSALLDGLESPFGFHLFVAIAERCLQFLKQLVLGGEDGTAGWFHRVLVVFQIIFQMRLDPLPSGSSQVRHDEQEFLFVGAELVRVHVDVYATSNLEGF